MAKRKRKSTKKQKQGKKRIHLKFELYGLICIAISIIAVLQLGVAGQTFIYMFRFFAGEWFILCFLGLFLTGVSLFWKKKTPSFLTRRKAGLYCIIASMLLLSHVQLFQHLTERGIVQSPSVIQNTWELFLMDVKGETGSPDLGGGMIGAVLFAASYFLFASAGSKIIAVFLILIGLLLITDRSLQETLIKWMTPVASFIKNQWQAFLADIKQLKSSSPKKKSGKKQKAQRKPKVSEEPVQEAELDPDPVIQSEPIISSFSDRDEKPEVQAYEAQAPAPAEHSPEPEAGEDMQATGAPEITFTELENKDYQLPSIQLLDEPKHTGQQADKKNIYDNARKLEKTFQSFGVKAKVTQVHLGPAVTKYEVYPDVGVKVSKIVNLSDDLALALAAKDIRIEAPIPGKSAIGIEVPNAEVAMVSLKEVLESKLNDRPDAKLMIGLGRNISGEAVLAELNKMPHLLVAGATGSGKSVCVNGIITSILMRAKPHEVKMMMIDPKMVELNVYNGIPHLLAPVVTDPKKASQALKKVVNEMERRYELFSHTGTRNIEGYNDYIKRMNAAEEAKQPELPYIIVIVDELADLMMVASSDVEDSITRLSQMARAAGIHLIIATQRPSVDVITGVIKANIPSRIAFSVSSQTDSRTILDMGGAEKLLGRGDMLFLPVGANKPLRVQGAFLSDEEVEKVVDHVITQQKAQYQEEMIPEETQETVSEVTDDLYDEAVALVVSMQTASVSMLQRRFRIGYTRAARLIDAMEERGIVGPYEGSKPREVLLSKEQYEELSS
ncbi:DNA translocase SpoIIIE [Bacillus paralicheniformis]|uniref:Cell division protein FtsK n=1 Tax=Bacillus paralicheniformis TaxID=1648923 RepID=A0A6I7TP30_9BACI|nr:MULTISPECIES: DNA translocase FtsK [Bacillus]ETB69680.1 cell division protein FtsK [Bacillus sp. CPSM8]KUL19276.1 cell division protein FtsK [Bacillus licheniformis LMG 6934]POO82815.1 DNA translocase FtsK [Bacillus sp. MBGLi97]AJO18154.1 DNA translocase SpoIIIE [Bacillus paralicheniformis]ARA85679.1 DNA translocase FtsK [Bacillus paralicheniformis]